MEIPRILELAWEQAYPGREAAERNACYGICTGVLTTKELGRQRRPPLPESPARALTLRLVGQR